MDKKEPLVSIIVPVFNVEEYLARCIDSLISQTYKNIEIILIDDGSTDNSPSICDEYANLYSNIRVIHQINMGLSGARNSGLEVAKGEYVTFVDSDDWLSSDMIDINLKNMDDAAADIGITHYYGAFPDGKLKNNVAIDSKMTFSSQEALKLFLFPGYLSVTAWGKVYKKSLWDEVKFEQGKLHEDQYTTYLLLDKAAKIIFDPSPKYYYYQRPGSIGHSKFTRKTYDLWHGIEEEYKFISTKYPEIYRDISVARIFWQSNFINTMIRSDFFDEDIYREFKNNVNDSFISLLKCKYLNIVRKSEIILMISNISLYKRIYAVYKGLK